MMKHTGWNEVWDSSISEVNWHDKIVGGTEIGGSCGVDGRTCRLEHGLENLDLDPSL